MGQISEEKERPNGNNKKAKQNSQFQNVHRLEYQVNLKDGV